MSGKIEWERQNGESSQAFAAFVIYRDLGPYRSLEKAYKRHKPDANQLSGQWSEWSAQHSWLVRALAYDDFCDAARRQVREKRLRELEERRADLEISEQDAVETWIKALDEHLLDGLNNGFEEIEEESLKGEDGELRTIRRKLSKIFPSFGEVARLLKVRHETLRVAVEGPRTKPKPEAKDTPDPSPGSGGAQFVWTKPEPPPDEPKEGS